MQAEEWLQHVKKEDLPDSCQHLVDIIGIENMVRLMKECGGTYFYIPKSDSLIRTLRDRAIRQEYEKGTSIRNIAMKCSLTESRVRTILFEQGDPNQVTIFDIEKTCISSNEL